MRNLFRSHKWPVISVGVLVLVGLIVLLSNSSNSWSFDSLSTKVNNGEVTADSILSEANINYPTTLELPSIDLKAPISLLGINADNQELEVPEGFDEVGWYIYSPVPGEVGPAVIAGHVDSYTGPAVFFSIGQLEDGEEVSVTLSDGLVKTFAVYKSELYSQDNFNTQAVYGNTDGSELRLITCSGTFDRSIGRYSDNLVVYARLVE